MSYQSPITMYTDRMIKDIVEKQYGYLIEEVQKVGFDINKEELAKALKYDRDQYIRGFTDGRMYKPPVITNYDLLISKTPEELAEFLSEYRCVRKARYCMEADCTQCWLDWLKSPVEVDNG